jgi:hypothetical protein
MQLADFKKLMETTFGTDEAMGVFFTFEDSDEHITLQQHQTLWNIMGDSMPGMISRLPLGGSAVCCTDYAIEIFHRLPGRVQIFGFACEDNPTSKFALEDLAQGHDFAVVDGRYIVDPWPRLVPMCFNQMIFDLQDPQTFEYYGPKECWRRMTLCEETQHATGH